MLAAPARAERSQVFFDPATPFERQIYVAFGDFLEGSRWPLAGEFAKFLKDHPDIDFRVQPREMDTAAYASWSKETRRIWISSAALRDAGLPAEGRDRLSPLQLESFFRVFSPTLVHEIQHAHAPPAPLTVFEDELLAFANEAWFLDSDGRLPKPDPVLGRCLLRLALARGSNKKVLTPRQRKGAEALAARCLDRKKELGPGGDWSAQFGPKFIAFKSSWPELERFVRFHHPEKPSVFDAASVEAEERRWKAELADTVSLRKELEHNSEGRAVADELLVKLPAFLAFLGDKDAQEAQKRYYGPRLEPVRRAAGPKTK